MIHYTCSEVTNEHRTSPPGDYVILLHGYGRTAVSMKRLEWHLTKQGYRVVNVSYPATRFSVEELSDLYLHRLLAEKIVNPTARIHFVTHSLGGIIVRQYLSNHRLENLGRVVMLAPPNHGSEIVDHLKKSLLLRRFTGQSRLQLGTSPNDLPKRLGTARFQCGVIAGDCSFNPLLSCLLPGPNDGKVTVESAKLDGMQDFLTIHSTHTWLMWRKGAIRQTLRFLRTGQFDHASRRNFG
jgi:pimeloyl-ACP methyl ester carboxylesterase